MKQFISYIINFVFIFILSFHNSVMAFWDDINLSMWNHSVSHNILIENIEFIPDCHKKISEININNECKSICCIHDKNSVTNYLWNNLINQKKFDKQKVISYILSFENSYIYELDFISNIAPPEIWKIYIQKEYKNLVWITKSNT